MRLAKLIVAGLVCVASTVTIVARTGHDHAVEPPARWHYFVDFRARPGGVLGHTFIVYGRIDDGGRILESRSAGLYPRDDYAHSPLLPLLVVPGHVSLKREDPRKGLGNIYRRRLSAAQFARLQATVRRIRKQRPRWNFVFQNCNSFVGRVAREIGLRTPPTLDLPDNFVRGLYLLNES